VGGSPLKRREGSGYRPAPAPRPFGQLRRAHPQQLHDVGGASERIGDRSAAVERKCRPEAAADLGDQHLPGRDPGAVELGQGLEAISIGSRGEPEDDAR